MKILIDKETQNCVSPWHGLLVVMIICALISGLIYYRFKDENAAKAKKAPSAQELPKPVMSTQSGYIENGKAFLF